MKSENLKFEKKFSRLAQKVFKIYIKVKMEQCFKYLNVLFRIN